MQVKKAAKRKQLGRRGTKRVDSASATLGIANFNFLLLLLVNNFFMQFCNSRRKRKEKKNTCKLRHFFLIQFVS